MDKTTDTINMDRLLAPERFDADPESPSAAIEWEHWHRRFLNFALNKSDHDKLKLLFNYISSRVYRHISMAGTFNDAVSILRALYVKPINEVYSRHKLATRSQQPEESADTYYQSLMLLAKECNFKAITAEKNRDDFVRDAFIRGLSSPNIRQRLLEDPNLNLQSAYEKARSLELAHQQAQSFNQAISVNALTTPDEPAGSGEDSTVAAVYGKCSYCGFDVHIRNKCPARNATCNLCNKKGHYAKMCKSSGKSRPSLKQNAAIIIATNYDVSSSLTKAVIPVRVNGHQLRALIDTGSSCSLIDESTARQLMIPITESREKVSMASTSMSSCTRGKCLVNIELENHSHKNVHLSVLRNLCSAIIIGHDILKKYECVEVSFGGRKASLKICGLAIANTEPVTLFENLTSNCSPIAVKSRKHTKEDSEFIEEEIRKLASEDIIEESKSPWRAQVLVTSTANHKKRMVIDYSQTINRFTLLDAYPLPRIEDIVNNVAKYEFFSTIDMKSAYHQFFIKEADRPYTAFEACGQLFQFKRIPFGVTNGVAAFQRAINKIIRDEELKDTFAYLDDVTICGRNREQHDRNLKRFMEIVRKYNLTLNEEKSSFSLQSIRLLGYLIENKTIKPDPDRLKPLRDLKPPKDHKELRRVTGMFAHFSAFIPRFSEKIAPLTRGSFPLTKEAKMAFYEMKTDIENATLAPIDEDAIFTVETDASDEAIGAALTQSQKPVAFFSRTLTESERRHSSVEKEAYAIIEATRKWRHYLMGRHFRLITDQRSVAFMFDLKSSSKVKNEKILRWRIELSSFSYDIIYRPGTENAAADAFSRICSSITNKQTELKQMHDSLCHPGITRMYHWVRSKNLPFSLDDIKRFTLSCPTCCEVKPRFYKHDGRLFKSTSAFERLNIDFKGPVPSTTNNRYILTIIDEYSRYPFAIACRDMTSSTVIDSLKNIFTLFGIPSYVHSDRGTSFLSQEVKAFLNANGIATSKTTSYNPQGNGQVERYNGIIWRTLELKLKSQNKSIAQWESVIPEALNAIRSLLCTATNETPHERMFRHPRRSGYGLSAPSWLIKPGPVYLRCSVRNSKFNPLVTKVMLIDGNAQYAHVRYPDGRETSVSTRHLAPVGLDDDPPEELDATDTDEIEEPTLPTPPLNNDNVVDKIDTANSDNNSNSSVNVQNVENDNIPAETPIRRVGTRNRRVPAYLQDYVSK